MPVEGLTLHPSGQLLDFPCCPAFKSNTKEIEKNCLINKFQILKIGVKIINYFKIQNMFLKVSYHVKYL